MDIKEMRPIAEKLFADIRELTFDGVGISRESYGTKESATADYLRAFATEAGLMVSADRAANLVIGLHGTPSDAPAIWCGSHIDSVPQGGNYDGLAGVIAGLLCLLEQQRRYFLHSGWNRLILPPQRETERPRWGTPYFSCDIWIFQGAFAGRTLFLF
mgnify:CR=1 FL=1